MNWLPLIFNWLWATPKSNPPSSISYDAPIHGLRGLLYTLAPESPQAKLNQEARLRNIAHHLKVEQVLSHYWPTDISNPVVMKGFDYTLNLYPQIGLRRANDIDLLVSPKHFDELVDTLSRFMSIRKVPNENRFEHEPPSAVTLESEGITIDLHHTPIMTHQTRLDTDMIIASCQQGKLGQCDVLYPSSSDRLLLWLQNFAKNFQPIQMHHLIDLVLILKALNLHSPKPEWAWVNNQAKQHGLTYALNLSLSYLNASGLWCEPIEVNRYFKRTRHYDDWLRTQNTPSATVNFLKGLSLIHRTIPEGRLAVTHRLLSRL